MRRGVLLRLALLLCATLLAAVDVHGLLRLLRLHNGLRASLARAAESTVTLALPRLGAGLPDDPRSWISTLQAAASRGLFAEVELFSASGERLAQAGLPGPAPPWLSETERRKLEQDGRLTIGPIGGAQARLLTYVVVHPGARPLFLRFATPVPELAALARELRELLLGHALLLPFLILAVALLLLRPSAAAEHPDNGVGLAAYAEAVERLRVHGEAADRQHAAERERLREQIEDQTAMSRAGELTAGMVHEVRNALGTVAGYARLIERGAERTELSQAAGSILDECAAVEEVVRRFMEFVKRERLEVAAFPIDRLLARVAAREGRSHPAITVILDGQADEMARGDDGLLERAFENLVRNACQAARRQVRVRWSTDAERTVVSVSDDGPGLPPARRAELRPFFSTRPGGLGLGLALAYKIVHLHEGTLDMSDGPDGGLTVTVALPR